MNKYTFGEYGIPEYMRQSLEDYKNKGMPVGHFLTAVLENNLVESITRADNNNIDHLPAYAHYMYWHLPSGAWGSKEKVNNWIKRKGLIGEK